MRNTNMLYLAHTERCDAIISDNLEQTEPAA